MSRRSRAVSGFFLACTGMLSACGGGGGGGSASTPSPAPAPTPPSNSAPNAAFSLNSDGGAAPLAVVVDASASSDPDGRITRYIWDFGGTSGFGRIAQYTFSEPGTFTIRLTVTDDDGATDSTSMPVSVEAAPGLVSIAGTVRILSSAAVDADVNDRLTTRVSNDSFDEAQTLPTPSSVGGFANVANQGEPTGNLYASGDPGDFYIVSLAAGDQVLLSIAEAEADLGLRLWDADRNLVDAAIDLEQAKSLIAPAAGSYFIEVQPFSGASNYVLFVGQDANTALAHNLSTTRLSDPFIPGELIVQHDPATNLNGVLQRENTVAARDERTVAHLQRQARYANGQWFTSLYSVRETSLGAPKELQLPAGAHLTAAQRQRLLTLATRKALQQRSNVAYAELNQWVSINAVQPNDELYRYQWHYDAIQLPAAWAVSTGDDEVIVAVVDTGVVLQHPDLAGRLIAGFDFVSDSERALDGDGIDDDPDDPGDQAYSPSTSSWHGTHVAGTIGANTDNQRGVAGVTWQSRIMPIRVLGKDGQGSSFDVIQGIRYAAGLPNSSGELPAQRADIINLSLGSAFASASYQETLLEARRAGVILIAAGGNDGTNAAEYPAAYEGVIGVSATTLANTTANYSNFGAHIDLAAPGGDRSADLNGDGVGDGVVSTLAEGSGAGRSFAYGYYAGTSMAAPHVSGVAALMKAIHPALTPDEFVAALQAGELTDDLGAVGRDDRFGHGLLNAQKAVLAAQRLASGQSIDPGPILSASPTALNFGAFTDALTISLRNLGSGDIVIESISDHASWLTVEPPAGGLQLGNYRFTVDRTSLVDGVYQTPVTFVSSAGSLTVRVTMQVTTLNFSANAGLFYVIVVDENTETVAQAIVDAVAGEYPFRIENVPAGEYRLFAGSDADDDAILCDAGEACGAFPTLDAPQFIPINSPLESVEFEAGFRVLFGTTKTASATPPAPTETLRIGKQ